MRKLIYTQIVNAIIDSPKKYQIVDAKDTDVLIAIMANIHLMGTKVIYMRRAKNDVLDIPKITEGLRRKGLNLRGIPLLYVLTGTDQTSFIYSIGKPTA